MHFRRLYPLVASFDGGREKSYRVDKFSVSPGIYYEEIGTMSITSEIWKLVIKMDLSAMTQQEGSINEALGKLKNLCTGAPRDDALCSIIADTASRLVSKVDSELQAAYDITGVQRKRSRRGLINGLGTIIKAITGNMDAQDAEEINARLDSVMTRQETVEDALNENIQILESTIHAFNQSTSRLEANQKVLHALISQVENSLNDRIDALAARQKLDERMTSLSFIVESLLSDVRQLIEFLAGLSKGIVNPSVLSPRQLEGYLKNALLHLPRGYTFPTKIIRSEMPNLLRLSEVGAYSSKNNLVIVVKIPLVNAEEYRVVKAYPLPALIQGHKYQYIETTNNPIIVESTRKSCIPMTNFELQKCKTLLSHYYCETKHASLAAHICTACETAAYIAHNTAYTRCERRIAELDKTLIIALETSNVWLYVAPEPETLLVHCGQRPVEHVTLTGTGTLALDGKCSVTTPNFRLETLRETTQKEFISFLPMLNLTFPEEDVNEIKHVTLNTLLPHEVISDPSDLINIGERLKTLKNKIHMDTHKKISYYHTIGNYSLSALVPIVFGIACIIYACKQRGQKPTVVLYAEPSPPNEPSSSNAPSAKRKLPLPKLQGRFKRNVPPTNSL